MKINKTISKFNNKIQFNKNKIHNKKNEKKQKENTYFEYIEKHDTYYWKVKERCF